MLLLLASAALVLLLVLAGWDAAAGDFLQAVGLVGLFVYLVVLTVTAIYCRCNVEPDTSTGAWLLFGLLHAVVLFFSLVVVVAADWLRPMQLQAHDQPLNFVLRNLGISLVAATLLVRYLALQARWRRQVGAEAEARMRSLQSSIHPHFLFNTLNTISSLIHDRPDEAERATMDLADLLRSGLSERSRHSLGDELELVRGYLRIEQLRLVDRLKVDWRLAEDLPLDQELPALLLQPLVENAVVHGIARLPVGGVLRIEGGRDRRGRVRFVVENPVADDAEGQPGSGNRMALDNVRQRLELAWEEGARLKTRREGGRFRAELILPIGS